jgi:hypothetical protein
MNDESDSDTEIEEEVDYNLEEGEFVPPEDWTSISDVGLDEGVDPDVDIDEHIVSPSQTKVIIQDEDGERVVDLDENLDETTDSEDDLPDRLKDNPMFRPLKKMKKVKTGISEVDITGKRVPKRGIIGWYYDADLKLFAIKRYDGVQYFEKKLAVFSSLPRFEIRDLARLELNNPSNDPFGRYVEKIIKTEGWSMKFERIKPRIGKTIKLEERSERTGRRRRKKIYPAVKCMQQIPLKTMPQDILGNLKRWSVDSVTGEALMFEHDDEVENEEREILKIYDRRHLMNLSKADLLMLHKNRITAIEGWEDVARDYQSMVKTCIKLKIYAGSKIYK